MDQDTMVSVDLPAGWRLVDELVGRGFPIDAAFWAKMTDEERWRLYLASPKVDELGIGESYRFIHEVLRDMPELGLDMFKVSVLSAGNTLAKAAADLVKPRVGATMTPTPSRKPYHGIRRFNGGLFGGHYVDAAFIYPPWEPGIEPVG